MSAAGPAPSCLRTKRTWLRTCVVNMRPQSRFVASPPTCTTSAPGKNTTCQPASRMRYCQSDSSLNMKNDSSTPPTCSTARRRTSIAAPLSHSTSRSVAWSQFAA